MAFESLSDFFSMCYVAPIGDVRCHGAYVWVAYGLAVVVVAGNLIAVVKQKQNVINQVKRRIRRE